MTAYFDKFGQLVEDIDNGGVDWPSALMRAERELVADVNLALLMIRMVSWGDTEVVDRVSDAVDEAIITYGVECRPKNAKPIEEELMDESGLWARRIQMLGADIHTAFHDLAKHTKWPDSPDKILHIALAVTNERREDKVASRGECHCVDADEVLCFAEINHIAPDPELSCGCICHRQREMGQLSTAEASPDAPKLSAFLNRFSPTARSAIVFSALGGIMGTTRKGGGK